MVAVFDCSIFILFVTVTSFLFILYFRIGGFAIRRMPITDLQSVNCFNQCRYVDYKSTLTIVRIANPHGRCFCPMVCLCPAFALAHLALYLPLL